MALYKDEVVILQKENVAEYFKREKPSLDLTMGYRDGTLETLRLIRELTDDKSIQTVDQMRDALNDLRKNRLEVIDELDKAEASKKNKNFKIPRPPKS